MFAAKLWQPKPWAGARGEITSMSAESVLSVGEARQVLQAAGLRRTSCRVAVLQFVAGAAAPVTHADACDELVPQGFDKSTIYRSLIEFAEVGILARLDLGDHVWRFELRQPAENEDVDHPHFMCLDCGKVVCLPRVEIKISPSDKEGGGQNRPPGDVTQVLLKGHCEDCQ